LLQHKEEVTIIDFGGGEGEILNRISKLFNSKKLKLISVDTIIPVNNNKVIYLKRDLTKKLNLSEKADIIISTHVIEHIPINNIKTYVKNILSVSKKGTYIYIECPAPHTTKIPSLNYFNKGETPFNFYDEKGNFPHIRPYSPNEIHNKFGSKMTKLISQGANINTLPLFLAPFYLIKGIILRNRDDFGKVLWNITGWANYALLRIK
jgi:hypothetical protein